MIGDARFGQSAVKPQRFRSDPDLVPRLTPIWSRSGDLAVNGKKAGVEPGMYPLGSAR